EEYVEGRAGERQYPQVPVSAADPRQCDSPSSLHRDTGSMIRPGVCGAQLAAAANSAADDPLEADAEAAEVRLTRLLRQAGRPENAVNPRVLGIDPDADPAVHA